MIYGGGAGGTGADNCAIFYNHDPLLSGFGVGICYDVDLYYLSSNQFFNGNWKHIVIIYDQPTSKMIFYLNGQLIDEKVHPLNTLNLLSNGFNLGIENGSYLSRPFFGKIDDVRIYNRSLSDTEIQQLYHEGGWQK